MSGALTIAMLAALGACSGTVSGQVLDAATGRPVSGAVVVMRTVGWGRSNGQLVWDAEKSLSATADGEGRFTLGAGSGGGLAITAPDGRRGKAEMCSSAPMVVRIGGPYAALAVDRLLVFGSAAGDLGGTPARSLGVSASGDALGDGRVLKIEAVGGARYVEGTGSVPPAPPLPYGSAVALDTVRDCGWLFIADGTAPVAVIQVRPPSSFQAPGGERQYMMLYAPLPTSKVAAK
ncbi:MAG: hypothetical protein ABIT16_09460 [Croceibacterium sp.]